MTFLSNNPHELPLYADDSTIFTSHANLGVLGSSQLDQDINKVIGVMQHNDVLIHKNTFYAI